MKPSMPTVEQAMSLFEDGVKPVAWCRAPFDLFPSSDKRRYGRRPEGLLCVGKEGGWFFLVVGIEAIVRYTWIKGCLCSEPEKVVSSFEESQWLTRAFKLAAREA